MGYFVVQSVNLLTNLRSTGTTTSCFGVVRACRCLYRKNKPSVRHLAEKRRTQKTTNPKNDEPEKRPTQKNDQPEKRSTQKISRKSAKKIGSVGECAYELSSPQPTHTLQHVGPLCPASTRYSLGPPAHQCVTQFNRTIFYHTLTSLPWTFSLDPSGSHKWRCRKMPAGRRARCGERGGEQVAPGARAAAFTCPNPQCKANGREAEECKSVKTRRSVTVTQVSVKNSS